MPKYQPHRPAISRTVDLSSGRYPAEAKVRFPGPQVRDPRYSKRWARIYPVRTISPRDERTARVPATAPLPLSKTERIRKIRER